MSARTERHRWSGYIDRCSEVVAATTPFRVNGHLTRAAGLVMEAAGLQLPVGGGCNIVLPNGHPVGAEVVGFSGDRLFLMATEDAYGLAPGVTVYPAEPPPQRPRMHSKATPYRRAVDRAKQVPVGEGLLGRVLDGTGRPLDEKGALLRESLAPLYSRPINPLDRTPISSVLDVGVRAINALLTVGRGQRMGLFAGSGVGKSVLLGMMARYTNADVIVVGPDRRARAARSRNSSSRYSGRKACAARSSSRRRRTPPPLMRMQGAAYATTIAEYFRDQGKHVLLIMDSLTRYAMAQREIALAIGEPPATKGYPPSVFAKLPQAGRARRQRHPDGRARSRPSTPC